MAGNTILIEPKPFDTEKQEILERAWAQIDEDRIKNLLVQMVNIPSPTGGERRLAEYVASYMGQAGLEAFSQPINDLQANAVGRLRGSGGSPDLLLYAPLDTDFTGIEDEDCPGVGVELPPALQSRATEENGYVVGLGAVNPKGFATCVVMAAEVIKRAGIQLRGSLIVGLGAGGMPCNRSRTTSLPHWNIGQGTGCSFMLEQGIRGDFAIIAKPGWAVAWEEVGLCWFKVMIKGNLGYVGSRHTATYSNAIVNATTVIQELEKWFPIYTARNRSGLVAPQGVVGAIEGGWVYKPSFIPATCTFYVDLRISPRTAPMEAKRQFAEAIAMIQENHPEIGIDWEMVLSIPGESTNPANWIIQSCIRAWEYVERRSHKPLFNTSGATDGNILRNRGIPTARIGLPRDSVGIHSNVSPRAASIANMHRLIKCLVYSAIDTCTRDFSEVDVSNVI
jgi:acetylornithine deacetylase/succinyl-diaminopimelate desuccinylase-like protein